MPPGPQTVLTNARQVLSLPRPLADSRLPVRFEGVLTCYLPSTELCFVQDGTAGIYVLPSSWPRELEVGQVVRLEGFSGAGRFAPIVHLGLLEPTGRTEALSPLPVSLEDINTGRHDAQSIVVEAVVRGQTERHDHTELLLANGSSRAVALVFGGGVKTNLLDARVKLTGVAGTSYKDGQLAGFSVLLHDRSFVEVVIAPLGDPFAAPLRSASSLAWYAPEGALEHRIRLRGTVTLARTNVIFMQSDGRPVRVNVTEGNAAVKPGDVVEGLGFIRDPTGQPQLDEALYRVMTNGPSPEPLALQPDERLGEEFQYQFVAVTAQVLHRTAAPAGGTGLAVERNGEFFTVHLPPGKHDLPAGSRVRLAGVWVPPGEAGAVLAQGLWVPSGSGVALLTRPPVEEKPSNYLPAAAAGLSTLAAVALLLGFLKSRREASSVQRTRQALEEKASEAERQLQGSLAVRERLAQDLHDHIIQSIYALGLKVDDCTHQIQKDPEQARQRLQSVPGEVNAVIRDLRNVILGIETNAIHPQEFKTALKSLALTLSLDQPGKIRIDVEQSAVDALTQDQATELIHLAREAVSNSLRHANAQATTLRLHRLDGHLRFMVEDDGKGFNPDKIEQKGFGLRNMARRAENLRARFKVQSEPGKGTIIMLDIPRQKQHF